MASSTIEFPQQHKEGKETEDLFVKSLSSMSDKYIFTFDRYTTDREQVTGYGDQYWNLDFGDGKSKSYKVEVKRRKRIERPSNIFNEDLLVELWQVVDSRQVRNAANKGNWIHRPGWLFAKHTDLIAFETGNCFYMFVLKKLRDHVCEKLGITGPDDSKIEANRILTPRYAESPHYDLDKPQTNQIYHRLQQGCSRLNDYTDRRDAFVNLDLKELVEALRPFRIPLA